MSKKRGKQFAPVSLKKNKKEIQLKKKTYKKIKRTIKIIMRLIEITGSLAALLKYFM